MKKLVFLSLFMFLALCVHSSLLKADIYPESSAGVTPPVGYGGLNYSTRSFTTSSTTVTGPLTVNSVCFSTSQPVVFVELRTTTQSVAIIGATLATLMRVYNSAKPHNSTTSVLDTVASGCMPVNLRLGNNLVWDVSVSTLNFATVLHQKLHGKSD